ncbi:MAG TPA: hypothetical protein VF070_48305 [Streptosporangiaceae bacterium]
MAASEIGAGRAVAGYCTGAPVLIPADPLVSSSAGMHSDGIAGTSRLCVAVDTDAVSWASCAKVSSGTSRLARWSGDSRRSIQGAGRPLQVPATRLARAAALAACPAVLAVCPAVLAVCPAVLAACPAVLAVCPAVLAAPPSTSVKVAARAGPGTPEASDKAVATSAIAQIQARGAYLRLLKRAPSSMAAPRRRVRRPHRK